MSARVYQVNDVWDLTTQVTVGGVATTPASISLTVYPPSGDIETPNITYPPAATGRFPYTRIFTLSGRHRAVWRSQSPDESQEFIVDVRPASQPYDPSGQDIANVIPRYTLSSTDGSERGTFDADTVPTGDTAEQIGSNWANRVLVAIGGSIPVPTTGDLGRFVTAARLAAAAGAAYQIVLAYYPEKIELAQQLLASYQALLDSLKLGIEAQGGDTPGDLLTRPFVPRTAELGMWSVPPAPVDG